MAYAIGGWRVSLLLAVDFKEAGYLAHGSRTLGHTDAHAVACRLRALEFEQGAAIFGGHDLDELGQIAVPGIENGTGAVGVRVFVMTADELPDALGVVAGHVGAD